jgi:hypothetical protein
MLLKRFLLFVIILSCICTVSCVDDLDFEQAQDIEIFPTAEVDLIFFTLVTENFDNVDNSDTPQTERDTTMVSFLDDRFLRDNVTNVELTFRVNNSFVQSFVSRVLFLDSNLNVMRAIEFDINPSLSGEPVQSVTIDTISGEELEGLLSSDRIVNEVTLLPNDEPIVGELNFESKGVFQLRISDF